VRLDGRSVLDVSILFAMIVYATVAAGPPCPHRVADRSDLRDAMVRRRRGLSLNHPFRVMPGHQAMSVTPRMMEVGVATFSGVDGAERAFADARDRDPAAGWTRNVAFVEVHRHGRIVVRGTVLGHYVDVDGLGDVIGPDTAAGAIVGAAAGLPLGPSGFATGLVGGAMAGGAVEARQVTEPQGPAVDAIREQVPAGSSAVVLFADAGGVRTMYRALFAGADTFARHRLSSADEAELRAALAEKPVTAPPKSR
jgi:hypothetical protein